ncbi:aspartate/glutamate racemase family protein [uncultured Ruthenibacterium sp.]|uniref:aspartate/glutamate racemase family protein n=1 Tax=uncultured Ruthenibacterium sp. TaxID=1905347 RepID=UPI00349ECC92
MRIAVIHTTPATIASLGDLIRQEIPGTEVFNLLDDSILTDMNQGHAVDKVRSRWLEYARIAQDNGAQAILSACSTVGEFAEEANQLLQVPVYRIDEAMAREAVRRGGNIYVFATLPSTLDPTTRLLQRLSGEQANQCKIESVLVEGAYDALAAGNRALHDEKIADALEKHGIHADTIVLAQASMASAADGLDPNLRRKVLTSPLLGIQKLRDDLSRLEAEK